MICLNSTLSPQELLLGDLIKSFMDVLSVGFVTMKATLIIWDKFLISSSKGIPDGLVALALIFNMIKSELLKAENIPQLISAFKEKSLVANEYDFYLQLFNFYKDEDLDQLDQS